MLNRSTKNFFSTSSQSRVSCKYFSSASAATPAFCARKFTFQTSFAKFNFSAKFFSTTAKPSRSPGIAKIFVKDCTTAKFFPAKFRADSVSKKSINDSSTITKNFSAKFKISFVEIKLPVGLFGRPIITQSPFRAKSFSVSSRKFSSAFMKKYSTSQPAARAALSYSEKLGTGIITFRGRKTCKHK